MVDSKQGNYSLDKLRREVDEIDDQIHDLLMRRIEAARKIGERNRTEPATHCLQEVAAIDKTPGTTTVCAATVRWHR